MTNELPAPQTPLRLPNGEVIDPSTGLRVREQVSRTISVPTHHETQQAVYKARKSLADLAVGQNELNLFGLLLIYELLGLNDKDVSLMLNIDKDYVEQLRKKQEYRALRTQAFENITTATDSAVRTVIATNATRAANRMVEMLDSEDERTVVVAAKDILDRAGHRPVDTVEYKTTQEERLVIEFIRSDDKPHMPVIDINVEQVDGDSTE